MAEKEPFGYEKPALTGSQLAAKLERVDELVSLMLDDELDNERVTELETLLLDSREARDQYLGLVQLHADLIEHYGAESTGVSPVLAALGGAPTAASPLVPPKAAE